MNKKTKILVTGGTGFIGQEVVKQLTKKGYVVRVVSRSIKGFKKNKYTEYLSYDLRDKMSAQKAMDNVEYCIHLASDLGGVKYLEDNSAKILKYNQELDHSVLRAAIEKKIKRLVYVSSGMIFEKGETRKIKETDFNKIKPPKSGYARSKYMGERLCHTLNKNSGLNFTIARPFNVYGGLKRLGGKLGSNHVIEELINKVRDGQYPLELNHGGVQTRAFTHITDVAAGIIECMTNKKAANTDFNISSDRPIKIVNLSKLIWRLCKRGEPFKIKSVDMFKTQNVNRVPDVSKAKRLLNWRTKIDIESGISSLMKLI